MSKRIGVVGVSSTMQAEVEALTVEMGTRLYPDDPPVFEFGAHGYEVHGHFAGSDAQRADSFLEFANRPDVDAVWFGRGGYGSGRTIERVLAGLEPAAAEKDYLGYSDAGALMAALYGRGFKRLAHGPMPHDAIGYGAPASAERGLRWLVEHDPATLEGHVDGETPTAAFNIVILASLMGTPWQPDLRGHVVMLEELSEAMYRIDRCLFQIASSPAMRAVKGLRLGRWRVEPNQVDFAMDDEAVLRDWCVRSGIPYLGRADIGHDLDNKVVPLGIYPA